MTIATLIGTTLAVLSAWIGGAFDSGVARSLDVLFAFPGLLVALLAVAVFGPGFTAPVIALVIANIPWVARVVRSVATRERQLPYIVGLEIQGFSSIAIAVRHLIPNMGRTITAQAALTFAYATIDLAAINFLGLGIQPPTPDWGVMTAEGQQSILRGSPEESLFAGTLILIAVLAVTLLSYRLGTVQRGERLE
jgi:peptide/nickel transport system permease protein